ncbi:MAG: murein L,D-transpeptidase, partial [Hyphomicrobiaceae bacterium]|nr:murein L,D-transpeptidase [Hyphomicrobiaceae bacterium]
MDRSIKRSLLIAALCAAGLAGCSQVVPPHMKPIPAEAKALLAQKNMREDAPIMVRIFKEENELEIWKAKDDGRFHHFKTYPICNWTRKLGPKFKQGDKQAPEGFYKVSAKLMNPNSKYHLSFNLGFPNAFDKAHKRTGKYLMVHGDCRSAGCYAMTDALIEEIYAMAREAFTGGQEAFDVQALPFRMTLENMRRHSRNKNYAFWRNNLYQGYKDFEVSQLPPKVDVCERRYLVNVNFLNGGPTDPTAACPKYERLPVEA